MIDVGYVQCMARYNLWQNDNVYRVADSLSDAERRRDRGAFFGSLHATLNHLLWADRIWMNRLADMPPPGGGIPESVSLYADWDDLKRERKAFDAVMIDWADRLDAASLASELAYYSGAIKAHLRKPKWLLVAHMFNHQTHHRGHAHACCSIVTGKEPPSLDLLQFQRGVPAPDLAS